MKKTILFYSLLILLCFSVQPAWAKTLSFDGKGEITSIDPLYSRVTIKHGAIKGFAGDESTEFSVSHAGLLKDLAPRDLVEFNVTDTNGDVKIEKITKTGVAAPEEKTGMGRVVQDVLVGTGEVAKTITKPITPAHDVIGGTFDATTSATEPLLKDADTNAKQDF